MAAYYGMVANVIASVFAYYTHNPHENDDDDYYPYP